VFDQIAIITLSHRPSRLPSPGYFSRAPRKESRFQTGFLSPLRGSESATLNPTDAVGYSLSLLRSYLVLISKG
jgi:hypothetical protein